VQPLVRQEVYDTYWRFAAERQHMLHRRLNGQDAPWTNDPILERYKFCNAYRAADRVSQYLIGDVIYGPKTHDLSAEDTFMRIILFRLFSKEATWEVLEDVTGGMRIATLRPSKLARTLDRVRERQAIYTAAFILCAHDAYGHATKHRNHLELVRRMFRPRALGRELARARTLMEVYEALIIWPMIGPFMGYQLAIDLNYSEHLDFSEDEFTMPGPGALRGLRKVFTDFAGQSPQQLIMRMVDRQEHEFERLGLEFRTLGGRRLHAIDCQGLFCETDKYARAAFPELISNRVRIKQEYRPNGPLTALRYPPKWRIADSSGSAPPPVSKTAAHIQPRALRAQAQLALG
jgi:hypothetical protein